MIRMPRINQQDFKYSLYLEKTTEYKKDADGNIVYVMVKGKEIPVEKEVPAHYSNPVDFRASMQMGGKSAQSVEFGVDISEYSATITTPKGMLPITEKSLIWSVSQPTFKGGYVEEKSADYRVIKKSSSINYDKYILQNMVK